MTRPRVLELRHVECESPGAYTAGLADVADLETVRVWREPLPTSLSGVDAVLVMGGPMGANDGASIPWIDDEIAFIRRAVDSDVPVWGVCLGSQLLARALGAEVTTGPVGEIGVLPVTLTDAAADDPVWSAADREFPAMHWHYDTFSIPDGATHLATSAAYPNQVFRHGSSYGVQFHLEVDRPLLQDWLDVPEYRAELIESLGTEAATTVDTDIVVAQSITAPMAESLIRRWLTLV